MHPACSSPTVTPCPCLLQYLDRIGQLFFGVPPKQTSSYGGLLGKMGAGGTHWEGTQWAWLCDTRPALGLSPGTAGHAHAAFRGPHISGQPNPA